MGAVCGRAAGCKPACPDQAAAPACRASTSRTRRGRARCPAGAVRTAHTSVSRLGFPPTPRAVGPALMDVERHGAGRARQRPSRGGGGKVVSIVSIGLTCGNVLTVVRAADVCIVSVVIVAEQTVRAFPQVRPILTTLTTLPLPPLLSLCLALPAPCRSTSMRAGPTARTAGGNPSRDVCAVRTAPAGHRVRPRRVREVLARHAGAAAWSGHAGPHPAARPHPTPMSFLRIAHDRTGRRPRATHGLPAPTTRGPHMTRA